jgi:hypothetical protein
MFFTSVNVVIRIQHSRYSLSSLLVADGTLVVPGIEFLEVKLATRWLRRPESKVVGRRCVEPRNGDIVGYSLDDLASLPDILDLPIIVATLTSAEIGQLSSPTVALT